MRQSRTAITILVVLLAAGASSITEAAPLKVLLVLSQPRGAYVQTAQAIQTELAAQPRSEIELAVHPLDEFSLVAIQAHPPALVVTVGAAAAPRVALIN